MFTLEVSPIFWKTFLRLCLINCCSLRGLTNNHARLVNSHPLSTPSSSAFLLASAVHEDPPQHRPSPRWNRLRQTIDHGVWRLLHSEGLAIGICHHALRPRPVHPPRHEPFIPMHISFRLDRGSEISDPLRRPRSTCPCASDHFLAIPIV